MNAPTTEFAAGLRQVVISLNNIQKEFGSGRAAVRALQGVNLDIREGEYLSIMGPSGSGKSTLFNIIGGLDLPTRGTIRIRGVQMADLSRVEQARLRNRCIGYIFQTYNLIPVLTAVQNVALPLLLGGVKPPAARAKARELLEAVGLAHRFNHRPDELSGGQQQRVAIARALSNDPSILLADEPTGNLDSTTGAEIINRLSNLCKERAVTVISATHDHKMLAVSDRVATIRDGRLARLENRADLQIELGEIHSR